MIPVKTRCLRNQCRPQHTCKTRLRLEPLEDRTLLTAGMLDPTFGDGGLATTDLLGSSQDEAQNVAIARQTDGKMVVAGISSGNASPRLLVARYNIDGSLDDGGSSDATPQDSFGTNGVVLTDFGGTFRNLGGVAVDGQGRVVVAGTVEGDPVNNTSFNTDVLLARFTNDGSPDGTFGADGVVTTDFTSNGATFASQESASDMLIAGDGSIYVAGAVGNRFAVIAYTADGVHNNGFGQGGFASADFGFGRTGATSLAIDDQGRIVAAGTIQDDFFFESEAVVARFNGNGNLDKNFAGDGTLETGLIGDTFFGFRVPSQVTIDSVGRIVVTHTGGFGFASDLARFDSAGNLDTTFNGGRINAGIRGGGGLAIDAQDRVVVGISQFVTGESFNFTVARYDNGILDTNFGESGIASSDFGGSADRIRNLAIDESGGIIAVGSRAPFETNVGDLAVARYDSAGNLDGSFGSGGLTTLDVLGSQFDQAADVVAVQPDGKLIVVGQSGLFSSRGDFAVARYNSDGTLDKTFGGGDGYVTTNFSTAFGGNDRATAVTLDSQGRIVVAGAKGGSNSDLALARYTPDGTLDPTFGDGGTVVTEFFFNVAASSVAIQEDGRIVVGGRAFVTGGSDFIVLRYNEDGSLDNGLATDSNPDDWFGPFVGRGFTLTDFSFDFDNAADLAITPDGRIIQVGTTTHDSGIFGIPSRSDFALVVYNSDGVVVGKTRTDVGSRSERAAGVAIGADGSIWVAGSTFRTDTDFDVALVRYTSDGVLDDTFGNSGFVTTDFGSTFDQAAGLDIDEQGRIVVAGSSRTSRFSQDSDFVLVRYTSDGAPDATFADDGKVRSDFGTSNDTATAVTIDGNSRIVVVGHTRPEFSQRSDFALARYFGELVPLVQSVEASVDLQSLIVQMNDVDLDAATATDISNYSLLAANGDADGDGDPFNDGDDTAIGITAAQYNSDSDRITLQLSEAVFAGLYRLEIDADGVAGDGTPGLISQAGQFLQAGTDFTTIVDLTPGALLQQLLTKVEALGLSNGAESSLTTKLESALHLLDVEQPDEDGIRNKLEDFIVEVNTRFDQGKLTLEQRDDLIGDAQVILAILDQMF